MKKLVNVQILITGLLIVVIAYIFFLFVKWGVVESFRHYPTFDEGEILVLVSNFGRYGRYEMQFDYHNYPNLFNPFMSIGSPLIMLLAALVKFFGYHFYIVSLIIFFLVSIPLIFSLIFLLNSLFVQKLSNFNRLIMSSLFFVFLITNRLFYASPPTGGSFTHGPLGEPFSLLSIILSSIFLLYGFRKKSYLFLYISGVLSSLAYQTKGITILFFISQALVFIFTLFFIKIRQSKNKIIRFLLRSFIFFVLGFVTLTGIFWIWERSNFNTKDYVQYTCWKKVMFITKGSGFNNLMKLNVNRLEGSFNNASAVLINFFSNDIGKPWGVNNKFVITSFFTLLYFFVINEFINKSKFLLISNKNINNQSLSHFIVEYSLTITFLLGSFWFFFISDFQWIRHYYVFIFIGFLIFYTIFIKSLGKKIFNTVLFSLLIFYIIFYLPKSPLGTSYHFREIVNYNIEEYDQKFISFYKPLINKKTYVCGIFKAQPVSFLSGINFYNNILEDSEKVYPNCNAIPNSRVREDLKPPFIYVNLASETFYPKCIIFFEENKDKFKRLYDYGNGVYETK